MQTILISAILSFGFFTGYAQSDYRATDAKNKQASQGQYSFMWGLFKSKNYKESSIKPFQIKFEKSNVVQSDDVENKRALWGAVQWTEKKKPVGKTDQ